VRSRGSCLTSAPEERRKFLEENLKKYCKGIDKELSLFESEVREQQNGDEGFGKI
jgi:hypothetical protein